MSVSIYGENETKLRTVTSCSGGPFEYPTRVRVPLDEEVNWSNVRARALFEWMGIPYDDGCGHCSLPIARRGVMRARNTSRAPAIACEANAWGDTLRSPRVHVGTLSADRMAEEVERFAAMVERLARMGATRIAWG